MSTPSNKELMELIFKVAKQHSLLKKRVDKLENKSNMSKDNNENDFSKLINSLIKDNNGD